MKQLWLMLAILLLLPAVEAETLNGFRIDDALIPVDEIKKGGPARDGIPSLDNPE